MIPGAAVGLPARRTGYPDPMGSATTSELRIPADPAYVVVAKRAAAGFGVVAGLGIEALDDLVIAVSQACENAIGCASAAGSLRTAQIRIGFRLEGERLEVQVRSTCRPDVAVPSEAVAVPEAHLRAAVADARARAEQAHRRAAAAAEEARLHEEATAQATRDLALRVMSLFVDDCTYRVDERTGGLRVRLTKYR